MPDLEPIREKKVLLVEGRDENNFFNALMKYMGITGVEIREAGGKRQFKDKLPALVRTRGFSGVKVFAVIRDADEDAYATFESVKDILRRQNLEPPEQVNQFSEGIPAVGVFIMPGDFDAGMLEDLWLRTVRDNPAMACVNSFIECVSQLKECPHNMAKAKAQTFLAAMPEIANCVGIGAQKGYWRFDSDDMADLRVFIEKLR